MKKLFAVSSAAVKQNKLVLNLAFIRDCRSAEEAEGYVLRDIRNRLWPIADGFFCHTVNAREIPPDDILDAGYKAE